MVNCYKIKLKLCMYFYRKYGKNKKCILSLNLKNYRLFIKKVIQKIVLLFNFYYALLFVIAKFIISYYVNFFCLSFMLRFIRKLLF